MVCCALSVLLSYAADTIQLKVIEGDGITYRIGARATRGLTVLVTNDTGHPLENVAVSFRLPDQGPSGLFTSGLKTEVVKTGPDGRAAVWGMQWNTSSGAVEIHITATKDQAHAGIIATEYLNNSLATGSAGSEGTFKASPGSRNKWLLVGAIVGGGAGAGMVFARSQASKTNPAAPPAGISIGSPSIIVGHP